MSEERPPASPSARRRECHHAGHGDLELLLGWWALQGMTPLPGEPSTTVLSSKPRRFKPDGRILALKAWRCAVCGYIELVDTEV